MRPRSLLVPLLLLLLPAAVFASSEVAVTPLRFGAAPGFQVRPALGTDGSSWFAAWTDQREDPFDLAVYGTRLTPAGGVVDTIGIRLFDTEGRVELSVVHGDGSYLVIDTSLRFAIVDAETGVVMARGRIAQEANAHVKAGFNGRDFVVFWGYCAVRVAVLDAGGNLVAPPATITAQRNVTTVEAVAFDGSRFLVLYTAESQLFSAVVSATGAPVSIDTPVAGEVWPAVPGPTVASLVPDGEGFIAVWLRKQELVAARIDRGGHVLTTRELLVPGPYAFELVRDGAGLTLYAIRQGGTLIARSLSAELEPGAARILLAPDPNMVAAIGAAGSSGGSLALAEVDDLFQPLGVEIYTSRGELVTRAAYAQQTPAIAVGAASTLIAWREQQEGTMAIHASWSSRSGVTRQLLLAASGLVPAAPQVAAIGEDYLVTWSDGTGVHGQLIRHGEPAGPPIAINDVDPGGPPTIAQDGRDFIVAWPDWIAEGFRTAKVSTSGEIVLRGVPVPGDGGSSILPPPRLACANGECLLAWRNQTLTSTCPRLGCTVARTFVFGERLDASSLVSRDPVPLVLSGDDFLIENVAVGAAGDGTYAVAWQSNGDVTARTVDAAGTPGRAIVRAGITPALVRQGGSWLLLRDAKTALVALRFGDALPAIEWPLFSDRQRRSTPALASDGGQVLAVYARTTREEGAGGSPRIYLSEVEGPKKKSRAAGR